MEPPAIARKRGSHAITAEILNMNAFPRRKQKKQKEQKEKETHQKRHQIRFTRHSDQLPKHSQPERNHLPMESEPERNQPLMTRSCRMAHQARMYLQRLPLRAQHQWDNQLGPRTLSVLRNSMTLPPSMLLSVFLSLPYVRRYILENRATR